jgi:ABC-2 type transport system ATP-binding protein
VTFAIQTEKLSKFYRSGFWMKKYQALHDLNLNVQKGEIFGFVGPNGAGKTTTIKILAGLQDATSGTATILSEPVSSGKAKIKIGFLPERPYFYVHLTPRELLHFYGQLYELPKKNREERINTLLTRTEMMNFIDVPMKSFSKGMLQRIGLCQALLHKPELLILDEPMSGLDPLGRALVRDMILEENKRGATIFFSSHVLSDVERICDRVAILIQGKLRSVDTVDALISSTQMVEFIISADEHHLPQEWDTVLLPSGLHRIVVSPAERESHIDILRSIEAKILEIRPVRLSLEDILVEEIKKDKIDPQSMGVWT